MGLQDPGRPEIVVSKDKLLMPDPVWELYQIPSLAEFYNRLNKFYLRPQVTEPIRRQLTIIHKLMLHSFFEYGFLDVALARALQVFEMAIKQRYKEVGDNPKPKNLYGFIKWADERGLLEQPADVSQLWRKMRNSVTHGSPETILGFTCFEMIYGVVDFINELYEDVEQRKIRHEIESELQRHFSVLIENGAILRIDGTRLIIFQANVICCVTENGPTRIHVAFFPIFDAREIDNEIQTPRPIFREYFTYTVNDHTLEITSEDGAITIIQPIADEINRDRYQGFRREFESHWALAMTPQICISDQRRFVRRAIIKAICQCDNVKLQQSGNSGEEGVFCGTHNR